MAYVSWANKKLHNISEVGTFSFTKQGIPRVYSTSESGSDSFNCVNQSCSWQAFSSSFAKSPPDGLMPIIKTGNGKCFLRSLSVHVYGSEDHHAAMSARIMFDAVIHKDDYLNDFYLSVGTEQGKLLLDTWRYPSIYEKEILTICKAGTEMEIWQLIQATNVLIAHIVSLYPDNTSPRVGVFLHRTAYPFAYGQYKQKYNIMWTFYRCIRPGFQTDSPVYAWRTETRWDPSWFMYPLWKDTDAVVMSGKWNAITCSYFATRRNYWLCLDLENPSGNWGLFIKWWPSSAMLASPLIFLWQPPTMSFW